ncbi:hypothetical protein NQZ79_g7277 [Umbelopsis isabellina]|nr:hypothetical protein NQZ79_g7277 [Umbelopsis isabellina]
MEKTEFRSRSPNGYPVSKPVFGSRFFTKPRMIICLLLSVCYLTLTAFMSTYERNGDADGSKYPSVIGDAATPPTLGGGVGRANMYKELRTLRDLAKELAIKDAQIALANTSVYSVTLKPQNAPSGDPHDYLSLAKYFWRNPDTPDGLPYIRRDGFVNPEVETVQDYRLLRQMLREVYRLGLAFQLTGNETYAAKASDRLYEWFVDPETKMNPHFHWGSLRKGNTHGSRTGILDMFPVYKVLQIIPHLQKSSSYTPALEEALQDWFSKYWNWLSTSNLAAQESKGVNNHGTYYDVQVIPIARFLGKHDVAKKIAEKAVTFRLDRQVRPNGAQPHEASRPTSWFYSIFNLAGMFLLAQQCQMSDVDMWYHVGPDGQTLKSALDYLLPYALNNGKDWPYTNLNGYPVINLVPLVEMGYIKWGDPAYLEALPQLRHQAELERENTLNTRPLSDIFCQISELLEDRVFVC